MELARQPGDGEAVRATEHVEGIEHRMDARLGQLLVLERRHAEDAVELAAAGQQPDRRIGRR